MNFAGSHYTAMIRVFHAWQDVTDLRNLCAAEVVPHDGSTLLAIQEACSGFWWNLGSAVDNLGHALDDVPGIPLGKSGKDFLDAKYPQLGYVYDRRTQVVHSRMVPLFVDDGMVCFNAEFLSASRPELVPKVTDWKATYTGQELVHDFYVRVWQTFLQEATSAWWHLHSLLQAADRDPPELDPVVARPGSSSGPPPFSSLSARPPKRLS
jgi:hypothetical protein